MDKSKIKTYLNDIIDDDPETIRAFVAEEALGYDNPKLFFEDLQQYGCISGMVTSLIYYQDTHNFFDCYYDDIQILKETYESNTGKALQIKDDIKNFLAWFAFEETAFQIYTEIDDG
ncbi:hypothetical protein [Winogradskyella sp. SYSU M77433]|uniref:DUF7222 domain-containing protein n=1 Tax=Winogradskyella sp. SYSU M77433 TaxID=3042722 RepID=UPI002480C9EE|nr:hypothetical protein [Winogradskyella sp. SYSU M77433]MDH7911347.1 hypothetical protein [Winogradskyella sp. SYSU M77433]